MKKSKQAKQNQTKISAHKEVPKRTSALAEWFKW
jgi:hypothetical protein